MENGFFRIADPLNGWQFVKKDVFWQSFAAINGSARRRCCAFCGRMNST